MKPFTIVAALDDERGIGKRGSLAWTLRGDLEHFRSLTVAPEGRPESAVVMGWNTWISLPERFRPLPRRRNVVLFHGGTPPEPVPAGVAVAGSLDAGLAAAGEAGGTVFVIGGATVYAEAIRHPDCHRLELTRVAGTHGCDVFFPELPAGFRRTAAGSVREEGGIRYHFETYER